MKLRFSMRTMLLLTNIMAVLGYWRDRPRQVADRFVEAIEAEDFELADSLAHSGVHAFAVRWMSHAENSIRAESQAPSWNEWLRGCRTVRVTLRDERGLGATVTGSVVATATGITRLFDIEIQSPTTIGVPLSTRIRE